MPFWGAQAASLSFSVACRKALRTFDKRDSCNASESSASCRRQQAGSLCSPQIRDAQAENAPALHATPLELSSSMPTEISIPDAEDLKSRVRELRRFL